MIREHDCVVLTEDLPDARLKAGDAGTVVHVHTGGDAYEVEVFSPAGVTIAVATVLGRQLRRLPNRDITHAR